VYLGFHFKDVLKNSRGKNFASYGLKIHNWKDGGGHDDGEGGGDNNDRHQYSVQMWSVHTVNVHNGTK